MRIAVRTALAPVCMKRCIAVFVFGATPSAIEAGSGARRGCGFEKDDKVIAGSKTSPCGHVLTECPYEVARARSRSEHAMNERFLG